MSSATQNNVKITRNEVTKRVTIEMERRNSWGRVSDRFQFTISARKFETALLDANIIAPWNAVGGTR